jgi:undecaprenyl-diphosphatase
MLGFERQSAARFSFLLSIPIIFGAGLLQVVNLLEQGGGAPWLPIGIGTLVAGLSALACIHLFLNWLDRVGMMPFVYYRLALGVLLLLIWLAGPGGVA